MNNPFTEYINQFQNNHTVTNPPNRSNDQTFILNTIPTTTPDLQRPTLPLLNFADTYSLSSTDNKPFQTNTNLNAIANPCQTLYQPYTAHNICPSALLPSSYSTVNPINTSSTNRQNYTVSFAAKN